MKTYFLTILFCPFFCLANTLKIGSIDKNLGFVKKDSVLKILSCTTQISESSIDIIELPKARVLKNFSANILDGYYPVSSLDGDSSKSGLFPLYIDEFLLISLDEINLNGPKSIGVIGDSADYIQKFIPTNFNLYKVQSVDALFGGLARKRSKAIAIRRSQIPEKFSLEQYKIKSLYFESMGVKINNSFIVKSKSSNELLNLKFKQCLEDFKFFLDDFKKQIIYSKLKFDIAKLSYTFATSLPVVTNLKEKEIIWRGDKSSKRSELVREVLDGPISVKLKKSLQKYNFITEAFVFDKNGALLGSISEGSDFDQSDEEKYSLINKSTKFELSHIQNIYFDSSTGRFQLSVSLPLFNSSNEFIGGIFFASDINDLLHFYGIR